MFGTTLPVLILLGILFAITMFGLSISNAAANRLHASNRRRSTSRERPDATARHSDMN